MRNLLVSTCITRRIRKRAIRDYQIGEWKNSPYPFNDCTYKAPRFANIKDDDFRL